MAYEASKSRAFHDRLLKVRDCGTQDIALILYTLLDIIIVVHLRPTHLQFGNFIGFRFLLRHLSADMLSNSRLNYVTSALIDPCASRYAAISALMMLRLGRFAQFRKSSAVLKPSTTCELKTFSPRRSSCSHVPKHWQHLRQQQHNWECKSHFGASCPKIV